MTRHSNRADDGRQPPIVLNDVVLSLPRTRQADYSTKATLPKPPSVKYGLLIAHIIWDAGLVRVDGSQPDYCGREGAPNPPSHRPFGLPPGALRTDQAFQVTARRFTLNITVPAARPNSAMIIRPQVETAGIGLSRTPYNAAQARPLSNLQTR